MKTLLVDGDMVLYGTIHAVSVEAEFDGEWVGPLVHLPTAQAEVSRRLEEILERSGCSKMVVALSDHHNCWRKRVLPSYKHNRTGKKPVGWLALEASLPELGYKTDARPGCEADDVLGILATTRGSRGKTVIASDDKDLRTVPGYLMSVSGDDKPRRISRKAADLAHLRQALMGDATDGYPGCPGVGPKTADKILDEFVGPGTLTKKKIREIWALVLEEYEKAHTKGKLPVPIDESPQDFALSQARVARILRATEWDDTLKEPKLWTP